jgi:hypothetical protein
VCGGAKQQAGNPEKSTPEFGKEKKCFLLEKLI